MTQPVQAITHGLLGQYLGRCRTDQGEVPPTSQELVDLFAFLKMRKIAAALVGSVAVLHYTKDPTYRPTHDVDVFVQAETSRMARVPPPPGWHRNTAIIGVVCWTSPGGGQVDFLTSNYEFPGGEKLLSMVHVDMSSPKGIPIATATDLFKLKLNSYRDRDFADLLSLATAFKGTPEPVQLGKLNEVQSHNLLLVKAWWAAQPK
jgi:hypothetical protein